ncbi:hypothetical protein CXB51_027297 [Gossypium anomalum]|uniref:Uncharacterized protein n=1 Tax=Gossypium anomalum TaxID=47600 RepID=A0A8J5YCM0_9ROSI|nr:hypothetical protein CXB51_027297 [Gossypium anomalum]
MAIINIGSLSKKIGDREQKVLKNKKRHRHQLQYIIYSINPTGIYIETASCYQMGFLLQKFLPQHKPKKGKKTESIHGLHQMYVHDNYMTARGSSLLRNK